MSRVNDGHVEKALADLEEVLNLNEGDALLLRLRIQEARGHRERGRPWDEILEVDGSLVQLATGIYVRLGNVTGPLQRSLVASMRSDKVSIPTIARLFGVTHQRISNIIRRSEKAK